MISVVLVSALLAVAAGAGQKSTCVKNGPCACTFDGFTMDLSKMEGLVDDHAPMYKDKKPTQSAANFVYSYKPCYSFDYSNEMYSPCKGVASCQVDTTNSDQQNAGKQESAEFWEEDGKTMLRYLDDATFTLRETYVDLVCAGSNSFEVKGEQMGSNPSRYDYTLNTPQACRPGEGEGGGLSVGSVLCILLVVFIVVYIVGGILFMKFRVGASGFELFPNQTFWKDFPALIKDGTCFIISPCRKGGEYSKL
ncbi:cation-dependent mannose-6-phosphate receptor-like [Lineus longissimus]|uniref:cation-dependent mannose-6-phosphate receptor-like n=1 Tax=Lineus longissimus TaxID=88925 RepID=UPI002B4DD4A0